MKIKMIKYILIMLTFLDCNNLKNQIKTNEKLNIDDSNIAILAFKPEYYWLFKNAKSTNLNNQEIKKIDKTLESLVLKHNNEQKKEFAIYLAKKTGGDLTLERLTINLSDYKRQYIAVLNSKGEKEVWVNMLCNNLSGKWRTEIIDVSDGGKCYFNLKINLISNKYYYLMFNGEA